MVKKTEDIKIELQKKLQNIRIFPKIFTGVSYFAAGFAFIFFEQSLSTKTFYPSFLIGVLLITIAGIINLYGTKLLPELLHEAYLVAEDLEKQVKVTQKQLLLNRLMARVMRTVIDEHLSERSIDIDMLVQEFILGAIEKIKNDLFGISDDEMWNFVVYLYNKETKQLECCAHMLSDTHPSYDPTNNTPKNRRTWKINDNSHIAMTYKNRKLFSIYNYKEQSAQGIKIKSKKKIKETDDTTYISFIAVPLEVGETGNPFGVFAATSNIQNRFNKKNERYLVDISRALSSLYALHLHDNEQQNIP